MAHTPGPWIVSADRIASYHGDIAAVHYQSGREQKGWHCADDARLIAAAPELLDALRTTMLELTDLCERLGWDGDEHADTRRAIDLARAAIDKAEGRGSILGFGRTSDDD